MASPMVPNFCDGAYFKGERPKPDLLKGRCQPSVLRAFKTPAVLSGRKLPHSPARTEKHAEQETVLHYTQ